MYHFFNFLYLFFLFSNILFSLKICNGAKHLVRAHMLFGVLTAVSYLPEYFPSTDLLYYSPHKYSVLVSLVFKYSVLASVAMGSSISWFLTARCAGGKWVYPYAGLITWGFYTGVMSIVATIFGINYMVMYAYR